MSALRKLSVCVLLAFAASVARAQFLVDGTEKTSVRWNQVKTEDYRFIYPVGYDSLARVFALKWEQWKQPVGRSIGREPNEWYRLRMPVVLHPYRGDSNGMVAWTPRRMEMYTGPDMVSPWPMSWSTLLSIHEQRHVSQMQFLQESPTKFWSELTGEALAGFFSLWYFDPSHFEGDAVAAETGLTQSGRARTASFLEYYRASFDEGQFRNYERWRFGSQRLYTPNYYTVGYLAIGGMRAVYDKPLFMKDYNDWKISYRKQVRRQTHLKFKDAFAGVLQAQDSLWRQDDSLRALEMPFQPFEPLTRPDRYYVSYSGLTWQNGWLYARSSGIADDHAIVAIDPECGQVIREHYTGADSQLSAGKDKIYWSETMRDPRWEMHSHSAIRYLEAGRTRTLVGRGRWFNPKAYGDTLTVCRTNYDGSADVCLLDARDGSVLAEFRAPDGLTPYEAVLNGGEILGAAVSDHGEGIYRMPSFEPVLEPLHVEINHLFVRDGKLFFTSDRTGVNELYSLEGGVAVQHTHLKAGGKDFVFGDDGQLYFTYLRSDGRMVCRTPVDSLPVRVVDFRDVHKYELEDRLSAQEEALALEFPADTAAPFIGEPRRYSKFLHAIKPHSWVPLFFDYDELSSMSFETLTTAAGLGATVYFQNDLNTFYGLAGYSFYPGFFFDDGLPLHSGIVNLTYRGLYPVFNGRFAVNRLGVESRLQAYVPLTFNSDGWSRGVIPVVQFSTSPLKTTATAQIRAYSVLPARSSCYYPHLGVGVTAGVTKDFEFEPALPYIQVYGYLPGLWKTSGLGMSLSYSTTPFENETITKAEGITLATTELVAHYAIPFLSIDWNGLSPVAYIRNFEFVPKASFTHYNCLWDPAKVSVSGDTSISMWTAGAALQAVLGNFWFVPYDIRVGVSASYVHGNPDPEAKPYDIKLVLSVDL